MYDISQAKVQVRGSELQLLLQKGTNIVPLSEVRSLPMMRGFEEATVRRV